MNDAIRHVGADVEYRGEPSSSSTEHQNGDATMSYKMPPPDDENGETLKRSPP